jgi:subtilase family serine protease
MYAGWSAASLEAAYNLPITKGKGQNVYIVDAYDNPDAVNDFAAYRKGQGLPVGKINKYNQSGQTSNYPAGSPGWGVEIDLDIEMASASCPLCTVNLIEANSNSWSDLGTAELEAVKLGGTIVSNSYDGSGGSESDYDTSGVTYLASSGDSGLGLYQPASFTHVVAVGGTFLTPPPALRATRRRSASTAKSSGLIQAADAPIPLRPSPPGRRIPSAPTAPAATSERLP